MQTMRFHFIEPNETLKCNNKKKKNTFQVMDSVWKDEYLLECDLTVRNYNE